MIGSGKRIRLLFNKLIFPIILICMADGCASGKSQRKQNSRQQRSITDELFKELDQTESEDKQGITPKELDQPVVKKIQGWTAEKLNKVEGKQRPPWASSKNLGPNETVQYIEYIKNKSVPTEDNLPAIIDKLSESTKIEMAKYIETHVQAEKVRDVESILIKVKGRSRNVVKSILTNVTKVTYDVKFNLENKKETTWYDEAKKTVWYKFSFDKEKYKEDIDKKIDEMGKNAYRFLKLSFKSLNTEDDVAKSLMTLGLSSYYLWLGGGSAKQPFDNIFDPGESEDILVQRAAMMKEIDESLSLKLKNDSDDKFVTKDQKYVAKIETIYKKDFEVNRVKLTIQSDSLLNHPRTDKLNEDGSVNINFEIDQSIDEIPYGKKIHVSVAFDISSPDIPDKSWYDSEDYSDLLKEFPRVEFDVIIEEFRPKITWAFPAGDAYEDFKWKRLQNSLEEALNKHKDYFIVKAHEKLPFDYERIRLIKSGAIEPGDLEIEEKRKIQQHDLDILLTISKQSETLRKLYTLELKATSPKAISGFLSSTIPDVEFGNIYKKSISNLVDKFVHENFKRSVKLSTPKGRPLTIEVEPPPPSKSNISNSPGKLDISLGMRFKTKRLVASSPGFRKQIFEFEGDPFSFYLNQNHVIEETMQQLVPVQGTLHVSVLDSLTKEKVSGKPPIIKVRKMLFSMFPNPFLTMIADTSAKASFKINKLDDYYVSIKKQDYDTALPKRVKVYDDADKPNENANSVEFRLLSIDPNMARIKSAVVPGWGHFSMKKPIPGIAFFTGVILTGLWGGYQYEKYSEEVSHYNGIKDVYLHSGEDQWLDYERQLDQSKAKLTDHRNQVYGALLTGASLWGFNIVSVTWEF